MKKIILFYFIFNVFGFVYSQDAGTNVSGNELAEVKKFIKDFKSNFSSLTSSTSTNYIKFPLKLENGTFNMELVNTWTEMSNNIKEEIKSFCTKIPDNIELDKNYEEQGYNLKMTYESDKQSYKIIINFDDDDWTSEEFWIKKINNKFLLVEFCIYSLMDMF